MKNTIGNFGMQQLLEFNVLFPDEIPLSPEQYMIGGSKNVILKAALFLLSVKSKSSTALSNKKFLESFFSKENSAFVEIIDAKIRELEGKGISVIISNSYSSLKLFEYFLSREEDEENLTNTEFEINLFKAYLIFSSEFTKAQEVAFTSTQNLDDEFKIPMMIFCGDFATSDKFNFDIKQVWGTQTIKAIYLFKFLESNEKTQPLLNAFLNDFKRPTWQEYLKSIMPLVSPIILNENDTQSDVVVGKDKNFEYSCEFIEKLIIQNANDVEQNDFLALRAKPFYKIEDGVYRIIFNLFVVEKIYKGVYFFLRDINDNLPKEQKISELKSFLGYEFSEKVLLYNVLESIYTNKKYRISGKELDDMKIQGAPDYYIHKGSNILLFEAKDFLLRADKKESFDFNIYRDEFEHILYYKEDKNGSIKKKAVLQLINSVERLLKMDFKADKGYHYKKIFIYPILITFDHQYDSLGFNTLINSWFQEELQQLSDDGLFVHYVKPLTIICIDTLIYHQAVLADDFSLSSIIDAYHEQISKKRPNNFSSEDELKSFIVSKQMPFSFFIDNFISKSGIKKIPSLLNIVAPALFGEDVQKNEE